MSGLIPEDVINRVRDSVDIVDLVSRYLSLKKAGASFKALCPFHKEKTPSFTVSPARQSFHCFGCGKGGNVFHFLMATDRVSFPEAVRALAKEKGIEIPETRGLADAGAPTDDRDSLYDANGRAAEFFARMLAAPAGKRAREYVEHRGISNEMVERCRLGYSPDSWDALIDAAAAGGVSTALLCKAGLAIKRDDRPGCYDRFRNRLMFPILDTQDRVIGFGARTMGDEDVKYLNTPETPLFSKGRSLYGLNWARKAIVDTKRVAVVEGYTDVIMAHQHGCEAVVATLGTALTRDHIALLRRFAERVDVVFDSDPAGIQAAERSMELFVNEGSGEWVAAGFDVRIAAIEGGKDPCDVIAESGPEPFLKALDAAVDVFAKKIDLASKRYGTGTVDGKTKAVDEVLELLALVPNAVGRELRTDAVFRALSSAFNINDAALRARLSQIERRKRRGAPAPEEPPRRAASLDTTEQHVIEAILMAPDFAAAAFASLTPDDFQSGILKQLFDAMKMLHEEDGAVNASHLLARLEDPEPASLVTAIVNAPLRPGLDDVGQDCVRVLLKRRGQRRIQDILKQLQKAKADGDQKLADELNVQHMKLQMEVRAL